MLLTETALNDPAYYPFPVHRVDNETRGTVLIVEDEKDLRMLLAHHLQKESYTVLLAENGKVACDMIDAKNPDVILLDILMPELDGWQVCKMIREHQDHLIASTPVIMLTALRDEKDKLKGLQLGADAFINKPYSIKEVLLYCHNFVQSRRKHLALIQNNATGNSTPQKTINQLLMHELRNHLTVIGGMANLLNRSKSFVQREKKFIATIRKSAQYLEMIANDIHLFDQLEDKGLDIPYDYFDLNEMITDLVKMLIPIAEQKKINLSISAGNCQNFIHLNKTALRIVLSTILENAVKYCPSHSNIGISTRYETGKVIIDIADNGPGIDDDDRHQIFDKNFRAQSEKQTKPGSGLGLYFAKILTEVMDGKITVESSPGKGSTFTAAFRGQGKKTNETISPFTVIS